MCQRCRSSFDGDYRQFGRVIGTQRQLVEVRSGHLLQVTPSRCWVESDKHDASVGDSMDYGDVPNAMVEGVAMAVVWPVNRWRLVPRQFPEGRTRFDGGGNSGGGGTAAGKPSA